jgi:hypothetical protein
MRSKASAIVLIVASTSLLTSCGVIGFVDGACVKIKKQSELKREIGSAFLEKARLGEVSDDLTSAEVEAEGIKYIIEGTELVIDNPQCFSDQDVDTAKKLIGR